MKKIFTLIAALCAFVSLGAQAVTDGTKWFDGKVLYTANVLENGELYFSAEENTDAHYAFSLRRLDYAPGEYMLIPYDYLTDAPFRAQFGWRVQYIRKQGMYFLAVRNRQDRVVWTLTLTPDSLENCLAQQADAEEMPVDDMLDGYLMNTKYLARFDKNELQRLHDKLQGFASHTIISQTNMDLIANELEVSEMERFALINEDEDQSDSASGEYAGHFALVAHFPDLGEAMDYIRMMDYPSPAVFGSWDEYESTFVVLPAEKDSVLEIWKPGLDEDYTVVCSGDEPLLRAASGKPLCFSYMVPEGMPNLIVVCRKADGAVATWVPTFSGMDGSLMTDDEFLNGEPVG